MKFDQEAIKDMVAQQVCFLKRAAIPRVESCFTHWFDQPYVYDYLAGLNYPDNLLLPITIVVPVGYESIARQGEWTGKKNNLHVTGCTFEKDLFRTNDRFSHYHSWDWPYLAVGAYECFQTIPEQIVHRNILYTTTAEVLALMRHDRIIWDQQLITCAGTTSQDDEYMGVFETHERGLDLWHLRYPETVSWAKTDDRITGAKTFAFQSRMFMDQADDLRKGNPPKPH